MSTYHVLNETRINGSVVQLRRMEAGNESAYVIVATKHGESTYANFSNRKVAESAYEAVSMTNVYA